ncbi:MAG: hypothetical protein P8X70_02535, partial [Nanoarchaeota archaeon]
MKRGKIILIFLTLSILLINFVSALDLYQGIIQVWDNIIQILQPIVSFLLGGNLTGGALFTKILIFTIILFLIWIGIEKINLLGGHKFIKGILVFAVSILAIQGISYGFLNAITLPYTVTGIAHSAGFPFLIYFIIVHKGLGEQIGTSGRQIAWIFFAVIFLGLTISNIGGIANLLAPSTWGLYWIYIVTIIASILLAVFDGRVRGLFAKMEAEKIENINKA